MGSGELNMWYDWLEANGSLRFDCMHAVGLVIIGLVAFLMFDGFTVGETVSGAIHWDGMGAL